MIVLKTSRELAIMNEACKISAGALKTVANAVKPGVSTAELDRLAEEYIRSQGAVPNFKGYHGYPATACISINNEVIHGIPTAKRKINAGDIVSVDTKTGVITDETTGESFQAKPFPEFIENIIEKGGLLASLRG